MPLEGVEKKRETMSEEDWKVLDRKALGTIRLSLAYLVAFNVSEQRTTAKDFMKSLDTLYEKPSALNKVFMKRSLKMANGGSIGAHLNEFNTLISQLWSIGVTMDDEIRSLIMLSSLYYRIARTAWSWL